MTPQPMSGGQLSAAFVPPAAAADHGLPQAVSSSARDPARKGRPPSDTNVAAVELRAVSHRYKGVAALAKVSLSIRAGEFFSLLGPSGCGKTTTLNLIGGFLQPDEGDVLIQGRSVARVPPYRRPVNTVFQSYALFPHMTVADNVGFGPRM